MIIVPLNVRCNFCARTFCCLKCRVKHEKNVHQTEINAKIREEYLKNMCFICRGEQFPIKVNEMLSSELIQHISEEHFPLKCDKCSSVFDNINDFQLIGKCCSVKSLEDSPLLEAISENMGEYVDGEKHKLENSDIKPLTPLSKINLRWRRKSKEFLHKSDDSHIKNEDPTPQTQIKRQTSTPLQHTFDSLSSMQFSSINCVSSSSETDMSPPLILQKPPSIVILSPKSKKKSNSPLSKSRPKFSVQNTPLRQVMTKSIQRAMATHGHYKHVHLQQRKMSFDSSSSSNEPTMSLMKLQGESEEQDISAQPLDLRISPAIRRYKENINEHTREIKSEKISHVEYEEIQVILRRSESESSSLTSFKSCYSDNGTPKGSSNNILKKTISFENPGHVEKSPGYLVPTSFNNDDHDDSEIFYTPRSTPIRRFRSLDSNDLKPLKTANPSSNIWSFVTSVMGSLVTGTKKEPSSSASPENSKKTWGFNFEMPLKAAANYFTKHTESYDKSDLEIEDEEEEEEEVQSHKRPRNLVTSPTEAIENAASVKSPINKRRKIQGRKPIDRMRQVF
ncbi:mitosis initiation protein fs(1)Ya [Chironomus tepperi]|uniref:mitosis initiation protein fs(1)Ya n=1 Tax=Chironomus tepperi TaxID=113505 RepID=UPI00391EE598